MKNKKAFSTAFMVKILPTNSFLTVTINADADMVKNMCIKENTLDEYTEWATDLHNGMTFTNFAMEHTIMSWYLIHLDSWENTYEHLYTLCHELHHIMFMAARKSGYSDEIEMQAYTFELLLRTVREELEKRYKKWKDSQRRPRKITQIARKKVGRKDIAKKK